MRGFSPNLYLAALGPLTELLGILVVVGIFALLRSQADRRPHFRSWELSFVFFAVSLTAGLFYERFVDPESVFYPASPVTTKLAALAFLVFRLLTMAMLIAGVQQLVRGEVARWLVGAAVALGILLAVVAETQTTPLAPFRLFHGPFGTVATAYCAWLLARLPRSRRSGGTRMLALAFTALAFLSATLALFYVAQRLSPDATANPWLVRYDRYGFYSDLVIRLALAWAMVRVLTEDGRREDGDTRAYVKLLQDRERLGDLFDPGSRLLARRAFDALIGLDMARASFGSVACIHVTNAKRVTADVSPRAAEALVAHLAGVVSSAVRTNDRVYRWSDDELLVVLPRAVPGAARERVEQIVARAAAIPLTPGKDPVRAAVAVAVRAYNGGEELPAAAAAAVAE